MTNDPDKGSGEIRPQPEALELPQWAQATRALLNAQVNDLDAATRSRLNQARQRALDVGLRPRARRWQWPALALASACGVMLVLSLGLRTTAPVIEAEPLLAAPMSEPEYEMLVAGEDLELIENLEFYAWLDQQSLDG